MFVTRELCIFSRYSRHREDADILLQQWHWQAWHFSPVRSRDGHKRKLKNILLLCPGHTANRH